MAPAEVRSRSLLPIAPAPLLRPRSSDWWGSNTFNVGSSATNGTQQMFPVDSTPTVPTSFGNNQSSFTLDHIPSAIYNVYLYYFNNSAGAMGQAVLETGSSITAEPPASNAPTASASRRWSRRHSPIRTNRTDTYFFRTGGGTR